MARFSELIAKHLTPVIIHKKKKERKKNVKGKLKVIGLCCK